MHVRKLATCTYVCMYTQHDHTFGLIHVICPALNKGHHAPKDSERKLSLIANKPRKFSPLKISRLPVTSCKSPKFVCALRIQEHIIISIKMHTFLSRCGVIYIDEYQTVLECSQKLRTAVQTSLVSLSGHLLEKQLITPEHDCELRNEHLSEPQRAAKLVQLVLTKTELSHENYYVFVSILERTGYHDEILKLLRSEIAKKKMIKKSGIHVCLKNKLIIHASL